MVAFEAEGYCTQMNTTLVRAPRLQIRQATFYAIHAACIHVNGVSGDIILADNICHGAQGGALTGRAVKFVVNLI